MIHTALETAQRIVQPHAWGDAVWHVWGQLHAGHNRPLVLLHGGSGSWTHWVRNVLHWSQQRPVWALDLPGFGDSTLPPEVRDADSLAPFVGEVLAQAFGGAAVDVVGFSFGGLTAGLLAAEQPAHIARLFLIGVPGLGLMREALPMRGMLPQMTPAQIQAVHRHNLSVMMLHDADGITPDVVDLQAANVARDRMRRRRIARTDVLVQVQDRWTCPVHGIWGQEDALYQSQLQRIPNVLHRLNSFHLIPDAGHWVAFEQAPAFHRVMDDLLRA